MRGLVTCLFETEAYAALDALDAAERERDEAKNEAKLKARWAREAYADRDALLAEAEKMRELAALDAMERARWARERQADLARERERAEKAEAENAALRAEVERLRDALRTARATLHWEEEPP
jgi:uncharacterized coiled-coil DUF342 family protein